VLSFGVLRSTNIWY